MVALRQRWEKGGGIGGNKERKRDMKVVILGVFTCSSHGCLAEMRLDLATDPPCQSASRCVCHHALFYCRGKMADREFSA